MSTKDNIVLNALRIAQEKQRIHDAIVSKGADLDFNPLSGYAPAIESLHVVRDVEPTMQEINLALSNLHDALQGLLGELT